jgi:3-phosphoinositide dependent protein kinase-1
MLEHCELGSLTDALSSLFPFFLSLRLLWDTRSSTIPPRWTSLLLLDDSFILLHSSPTQVILATQKATHLPYAIKILDQYQLVQEKKTKYAKIERDALVRLGPMAGVPKSTATPHPNGIISARGSRRGSEAEAGKGTGEGGPVARLQAVKMVHSSSMPGKQAQPVISRKRSVSGATLKADAQAVDIPPRKEAVQEDLSASQRTIVLDPREDPPDIHPTPRKPKKRPRMAHPGVVRLHYTFKDDTSLYFVLDLAINGELLTAIKKHGSFDVDSARRYGAQLIDTVEFMHERGVIHRDLKPENILLDDDMRIKVTDFGSAKVLDLDSPTNGVEEERKRSFVGTAEYVSPEVLRNEHASFASDIWAYGCILYQMLAGTPPFRGATEYLTFQQVLKAEFTFPDEFDAQAMDLIQRILVSGTYISWIIADPQ